MRYGIYAIVFIVGGTLSAIGVHLCLTYFKNVKEMSQYKEAAAQTKSLGKVLVVYYSLSGHTRNIAEKIKDKTNADIYEIKLKEKVSSLSAYASLIKRSKSFTELDGQYPDFNAYDLIFVGSPVWSYTVAVPVLSFLEQADFRGKKVVPFSTQGSNVGNFERDFKAKVKNAVILRYEKFNNISKKYDKAVETKISQWINGL
jgi:flavodoxin